MKHREQYKEWLAQNAQGHGLAGCAIGFSNKTWLCASLSDTLEIPVMETAMRCISDTFEVANLHHVPSLEQKWTFEKTVLFCARRPDKTFIAIFSSHTDDVDLTRIRQMIDDFKSFQPTADNLPSDESE